MEIRFEGKKQKKKKEKEKINNSTLAFTSRLMASLLSPAIRSVRPPMLLVPLHCSCSRSFSPCIATSSERFDSKVSPLGLRRRIRPVVVAASVEEEQAEVSERAVDDKEEEEKEEEEEEVEIEATPEELEYISEIQRVSEFQCHI